MALAMYSPNGECESVNSDEREQELRAEGWVNGHEYFSKLQEPVRSEHTASDEPVNKPLDQMTKAELLAVAKNLGVKVNPADKKEVILAAVSNPNVPPQE